MDRAAGISDVADSSNARDGSTGAADPSAVAEGRRHFSLALEHYRDGRYREALHELRLADSQVPSPELWFNMARALEQLGEVDQAIAQYKRYLDARPQTPDAADVRDRVAALEVSVAQRPVQIAGGRAALRIDAEAPGTLVKLDGKTIGHAPIEGILWVEPGPHLLEAELAGHAPFRAELDASPRSMIVGAIAMQPRSRTQPRSEVERSPEASSHGAEEAPSLPMWIAGAAAGASVLASTAARVSAEGERSAGDLSAAQSADRVANVTLATALASSAAALVFYLAGSRSARSHSVSQ